MTRAKKMLGAWKDKFLDSNKYLFVFSKKGKNGRSGNPSLS